MLLLKLTHKTVCLQGLFHTHKVICHFPMWFVINFCFFPCRQSVIIIPKMTKMSDFLHSVSEAIWRFSFLENEMGIIQSKGGKEIVILLYLMSAWFISKKQITICLSRESKERNKKSLKLL